MDRFTQSTPTIPLPLSPRLDTKHSLTKFRRPNTQQNQCSSPHAAHVGSRRGVLRQLARFRVQFLDPPVAKTAAGFDHLHFDGASFLPGPGCGVMSNKKGDNGELVKVRRKTSGRVFFLGVRVAFSSVRHPRRAHTRMKQ